MAIDEPNRRRQRHPNGESQRSVRRDVVLCLRIALVIATLFSAWVLAIYLFRGDLPSESLETTLARVILLYFCTAVLVGPLVGLLLPFARAGRLGAAIVGVVAGIGVYSMVSVAQAGIPLWTLDTALSILIPALLVGAPVGVVYRRIFGTAL